MRPGGWYAALGPVICAVDFLLVFLVFPHPPLIHKVRKQVRKLMTANVAQQRRAKLQGFLCSDNHLLLTDGDAQHPRRPSSHGSTRVLWLQLRRSMRRRLLL